MNINEQFKYVFEPKLLIEFHAKAKNTYKSGKNFEGNFEGIKCFNFYRTKTPLLYVCSVFLLPSTL